MKTSSEILEELNKNGWIEFNYLNEDEDLLKIAYELGHIIKHPNGNKIDYLTPKDKATAIKNTFSYNFGFEGFPFHTDLAFWNVPARYVILSSKYISKTATLFIPFSDFLQHLSHDEIQTLEKSIFLVKTDKTNFYSCILSKNNELPFIRFDSNCMKPVNSFAKESIKIIDNIKEKIKINKILWNNSKIFIFDNWKILHSREVVENQENRILKRIYIT